MALRLTNDRATSQLPVMNKGKIIHEQVTGWNTYHYTTTTFDDEFPTEQILYRTSLLKSLDSTVSYRSTNAAVDTTFFLNPSTA